MKWGSYIYTRPYPTNISRYERKRPEGFRRIKQKQESYANLIQEEDQIPASEI